MVSARMTEDILEELMSKDSYRLFVLLYICCKYKYYL